MFCLSIRPTVCFQEVKILQSSTGYSHSWLKAWAIYRAGKVLSSCIIYGLFLLMTHLEQNSLTIKRESTGGKVQATSGQHI